MFDFVLRYVYALEDLGIYLGQWSEPEIVEGCEVVQSFILHNIKDEVYMIKVDHEPFHTEVLFKSYGNKVKLLYFIKENFDYEKCPNHTVSYDIDETMENIINDFYVFFTKRIVALKGEIKKNKKIVSSLEKLQETIENHGGENETDLSH